MRVLTVLGTRPEAIKLAPVIRALRDRGVETLVCVTAQHREMVDQMLPVFGITPDHDLDVMQENQSPLQVAARVFERLAPIVQETRPDWLLIQGDTTTTVAAAWVAFQLRVPIAHVEAGLRTSDRLRPFPEEMNRRQTSVLADIHFAPTQSAVENLRREGIPEWRIHLTGNTVVDAVHQLMGSAAGFSDPRLRGLEGKVLLVTAHRRENFGRPLQEICRAVSIILESRRDLTTVFPVHPNPAVLNTVQEALSDHPRAILTRPLGYPEFLHLMARADLILSDSGGVQEEAPSVGTPVLVMRDVTERPEAIEAGWAKLVSTTPDKIVPSALEWLAKGKPRFTKNGNPFGDGQAARRIAELLVSCEERFRA